MYTESSTSGDDSNHSSDSSVGRNLNKDYVYEKTYPSLIEAKDGILNKEIGAQLWTRSVSYSTQEGDKICYTCRGYPRCPRKSF